MMHECAPKYSNRGKKVLLLMPSLANKLLVKRQGPYEVVTHCGKAKYEIHLPHWGTKLFHVNLLKGWQDKAEALYGAEPN